MRALIALRPSSSLSLLCCSILALASRSIRAPAPGLFLGGDLGGERGGDLASVCGCEGLVLLVKGLLARGLDLTSDSRIRFRKGCLPNV